MQKVFLIFSIQAASSLLQQELSLVLQRPFDVGRGEQLVSRWETKAGAVGQLEPQHAVSTRPAAVGIRQSKAYTAAAGRTGPRASASPLLPSPRKTWGQGSLLQHSPGAWHRELTSMTRDLANTPRRLQHIIVEARCEQLAMLEPLRPSGEPVPFPGEGMGEGRRSVHTTLPQS